MPEFNKLNRTFARRIGKRLSDQSKELLANVLPTYLFSNELLTFKSQQKKIFRNWFWYGRTLI